MVVRRYWVQAELHCHLCARLIGRLLGAARKSPLEEGRTFRYGQQFSVFHPADSSEPARRLRGDERFRCRMCGGSAIMGEVETFSTCLEPEEEAQPRRGRRGRPPKPWRFREDSRLLAFRLAG